MQKVCFCILKHGLLQDQSTAFWLNKLFRKFKIEVQSVVRYRP